MAVENKYVNSLTASGKLDRAAVTMGDRIVWMTGTVEIAAADDDGSVYRFFKSVPSNLIPVEITIMTDGLTGATDCDLGLYKVGVAGEVVDKDVLMDGQTLASALTRATGYQLGLAAVNIDAVKSSLATLSAQAAPDLSYDIALTANTVGSAAGTVSITAVFVQG